MSFFPNLRSSGSDSINTKNIKYNDGGFGLNVPQLPPVAYYSNKKVRGLSDATVMDNHIKSIRESCSTPSGGWVCDYDGIGQAYIATGSKDTADTTNYFDVQAVTTSGTIYDNTLISNSIDNAKTLTKDVLIKILSLKDRAPTSISDPTYKPNGEYKFKTSITDRSDLLYEENYADFTPGNFQFCDIPNILVSMGYKYVSTHYDSSGTYKSDSYSVFEKDYTQYFVKGVLNPNTTTFQVAGQDTIDVTPNIENIPAGTNMKNYIILRKNTTSATPSNNQSTYNACQTVMSRSRVYDVGELMTGGLYYGIKDLFIKMKTIRPILLIVLLVSVYLLVNGTVSSADIGLNITSQIAARGNSSTMFWIGIFAGILIPAIAAMISASDALKKSSKLIGGYNISDSPYGKLDDISKADEAQLGESTTLVGLLIMIVYILIAGIYYVASSRKRSPFFKVMTIIIGLLLLTVTAFILFYWSPLVSASDSKDAVYGVSRPLKVWTKTTDQSEISDVRSNKNVDVALRRFLSIYAIIILVVTLVYLRQSSKPLSGFNLGGSVMEGIMASCAILSLPILWIFNWYIGIKFFIGYPMLLLIVRYIRYAIYYLIRMAYISNPSALASYPALRQEFTHPENYTAPWDLMGVTAFKYMLKLMGRKQSYSEMMVDPRNSSKDIASNSYTTGHVMRMWMKGTPGAYDSYHTGTVGALTIGIFGFLVFYVIGKDNAL